MSSIEETAGLNWPAERLLPQFQVPQHLTVYDVRKASTDEQLSIATLAGLINRPQPQVYLLSSDEDEFWLDHLAGSIPHEPVSPGNTSILETLLARYPDRANGLIIYDPTFPDSINIATTMAGQQDAIVVSPDLAETLRATHALPELQDLRQFAWTQRVDAYEWALQRLLADASSRIIAGLDPRTAVGIRPFLVAARAFVYWLDSREYLPDLIEHAPPERALMQKLLSSFANHAVHLGWFIDEPSGVILTSSAAIPVLATDFMTNMETWTAITPPAAPSRPATLPPKSTTPASDKIYLSFIISDGDNIQYIQHRMLTLWRNPARGSVPLGWTFSPLLQEAAPALCNYYLDTATPQDELLCGPSGAGYMFPSYWPTAQLPTFLQRTAHMMHSLGMTHIEILDANPLQNVTIPVVGDVLQAGMKFSDSTLQQNVVQALASSGITGIFSGSGFPRPSWHIIDGVPVYQNLGIASSVGQAVTMIRLAAASFLFHRPLFINVYVLAWSMTPADIKQVVEELGSDYEAVTPSALLAMLAQAEA